MDKSCQIATLYIATLRAIYLIHQQNHWVTSGPNFYGDHLLFQRLYESAEENADMAAEKFLGVFGDDCLSLKTQNKFISNVLARYESLENDPVSLSLQIEKDFIKFSQEAYDALEEEGRLTLGLDDMIMSIANKREEAVYLLQQVQK